MAAVEQRAAELTTIAAPPPGATGHPDAVRLATDNVGALGTGRVPFDPGGAVGTVPIRCRFPRKGAAMLAVVAAVLFGLALIFSIAGFALGPITTNFLLFPGLLCVALHLAGVGASAGFRRRGRRR